MPGKPELVLRILLAVVVAVPGCALRQNTHFYGDPDLEHYKTASTQIEYPDVESASYAETAATPPPLTIHQVGQADYWDLTLNDALQTALANSQVLRDLGGLVLQVPDNVRTVMDPAIQETDPRFGVDAALSAFDASFEAGAFFENNDRALNNVFFGGGTRLLKQDLHEYYSQISKRSATGGDFTIRKIIDYDLNNAPGNDDPNRPWTVQFEGEFRQPLLQGAGVDFNRIAGPNSAPGAMNGVLLARINTDISLADFELGVRNLVNDVENAYWELYFAYRDLDAKVGARDRALQTWRNIEALASSGRRGGEKQNEAQAREQYFRQEAEVQTALTGRVQDRFRTEVFRGFGGVQASERRLRLLIGIPINDGRLIRPADEPLMAKVVFNWGEVLAEALERRAELRRQKWEIKRRELELAASRNFLLPRVDAVGRYRYRGLGHHLLNSTRQTARFDNAFQDLTTGDFQEWQMGVEVSFPFGYRQAFAGVRNAELQLARARAILQQQEQDVSHGLSTAFAELERAYVTSQTNYNRTIAAREQLAALEGAYENADESERTRLLNLLLDAQRRLADAESNYHRALIEYSLAVRSVHTMKGSLLEYNQVYLSEGPWPGKAYFDAEVRNHTRHNPPHLLQKILSVPFPASRGGYGQRLEPADGEYVLPPDEEEVPLLDESPLETMPLPPITPQ